MDASGAVVLLQVPVVGVLVFLVDVAEIGCLIRLRASATRWR